jgi:hypothetical protein
MVAYSATARLSQAHRTDPLERASRGFVGIRQELAQNVGGAAGWHA